jgi:hypothetical protein
MARISRPKGGEKMAISASGKGKTGKKGKDN